MKQSALKLIDLARERSGDRRRELMHRLADLFFQMGPQEDGPELELFDDVLSQLSGELETAVRAELANRMAHARLPPPMLIRSLAFDESIDVCSPVLQLSRGVVEQDLLEVAQTRSQDHLRAIARRVDLPTSVAGVIVERAEEATLGVLLANASVSLTRKAQERLVDRALENPALQAAVVRYARLPTDLLNGMYFVVEARLRTAILQRNAQINAEELDEALRRTRGRVSRRTTPLPTDFNKAVKTVKAAELEGVISPGALVGFLRSGDITAFLVALTRLTGVSFDVARAIHERRELDALAIVCKSAGFDRAVYITLAVLVLVGEPNPMGRAREYGEVYDALEPEVAWRTLQFWADDDG